MKIKPYFLLLISSTVSILSSSEAYGTKKFTQSFSSSSASSHASSYSSSSSYAYNNGQNPEQLAFIHGIPGPSAVAAASAHAGLGIATASAAASAHAGVHSYTQSVGRDQEAPDTIGDESHSGRGSYSIGSSNSGVLASPNENIENESQPDVHREHNKIPSIISVNDGSHSVENQYSAAKASTHAGSNSYSNSQGQDGPNTTGAGINSAGNSSIEKHGPVLFTPVKNDLSAVSSGLSKPSNDNEGSDQQSNGIYKQVSPNKSGSYTHSKSGSSASDVSQFSASSSSQGPIVNGGGNPDTFDQNKHNQVATGGYSHSASGSYSAAVSQSGSSSTNTLGPSSGESFLNNQGPLNNIGTVNQGRDSSYSTTDIGKGKYNQVVPNKIGSYSHSHSSQSSSSAATQNGHVTVGVINTAPHQGTYSTIGSGSQVQDGSYSAGGYNLPSVDNEDDGSYHDNKQTYKPNIGSGSYPALGSNAGTRIEAVQHSNNEYVGGSKGNSDFEKKYHQRVDETPAQTQTGTFPQEVYPMIKPHFPGPDGSIYDYKVPSPQSNKHTPQSSTAPSASYSGSQSIASSGNTITSKQCCKGPFPGPSGSIYDSKPASAVGTGVKISNSHPPNTGEIPKTPIIHSFPGSSDSIYASKPVATNIDNSRPNNNQWSASSSSGTYQHQLGISSSPRPLCTTSSPCAKKPQLNFPGSYGSIYTSNPIVTHNDNNGKNDKKWSTSTSLAQSSSYSGSQSVASSENTVISNKQCCKGPFPGPLGSILDSKPASAVGTGVKTSVSHPPLTRVTPKTPTIQNFPGSSDGIHANKPVVTNIDNNRQNNNKWSTSSSSGTYQHQLGTSSSTRPLCTTLSPCTNKPQLTQHTTPSSYLIPPVVHYKPVFGISKELTKEKTNTNVPPQYLIHNEAIASSFDEPHNPYITKFNSEGKTSAEKPITGFPQESTNSKIGYTISGSESDTKKGFLVAATHSQSTSTGAHTKTYSQVPESFHGATYFMGGNSNHFIVPKTQYHAPISTDVKQSAQTTERILINSAPQKNADGLTIGQMTKEDNSNLHTGQLFHSVSSSGLHTHPTHYKSTDSTSWPKIHHHATTGGIVQPEIKQIQGSSGSFSNHGTSSYSSDSKITLSMSGKTNSADSSGTVIGAPIDISTTIEKQVPRVYTNDNKDVIIEPVGISTTIQEQVPGVQTHASDSVAVPTVFEEPESKTYTSTVYINIKKPSSVIDSNSMIFERPSPYHNDKNTLVIVGSGSNALEAQKGVVSGGIAFSSSGSNSFGSSSRGFTGTSKHGCPVCGTSYRQYSNAVPYHVPDSFVGTDRLHGLSGASGASAGSYKSQTTGNSFSASAPIGTGGFSSSGTYGGVFPTKHTSDDGSGGFVSSIYLHNTPAHSAYANAHAKAGSFSRSYSKANSYASSSSFASSSSGSYSAHHY